MQVLLYHAIMQSFLVFFFYCASQIVHFLNEEFVATLFIASLSAPLSKSISSYLYCHILVLLTIFQVFHHYYVYSCVISNVTSATH